MEAKRQMDIQHHRTNLLIAKTLGPESQFRQLMEESAELVVAANKVVRTFRKTSTITEREEARSHLIEEMGDVCVVFNQIMAFMEIHQSELIEAMESKIDRTWQRIQEEREGADKCGSDARDVEKD